MSLQDPSRFTSDFFNNHVVLSREVANGKTLAYAEFIERLTRFEITLIHKFDKLSLYYSIEKDPECPNEEPFQCRNNTRRITLGDDYWIGLQKLLKLNGSWIENVITFNKKQPHLYVSEGNEISFLYESSPLVGGINNLSISGVYKIKTDGFLIKTQIERTFNYGPCGLACISAELNKKRMWYGQYFRYNQDINCMKQSDVENIIKSKEG